MKELIEEAKTRVHDIVEASKSIPEDKYLAIYEGDSGYHIGYIQEDWHTRTNLIRFGTKKQTEADVLKTIQFWENEEA
jgi:hypothetical protein